MELIKFIQSNNNWREILSQKPYCLSIAEDDNYVLLKYNQIDSDFNEIMTQQARGIILRRDTLVPVCVPFSKFFNAGEGLAIAIDWNTARVEEKLDGSIIKMWFDGYWYVSTNGTIHAHSATIPTGETFGDLFLEALATTVGDISDWEKILNKYYTYMFELCHPLNKIVVRHKKPAVYHIGTRDNTTFKELTVDIGIPKPRMHSFNSLNDVIAMAKVLPYSEEGYVIIDKNWNRVKVKSPSYVAVHHLKNNGVITYKRLLKLVLKNEQQEFVAVFPEFTKYVNKTVGAYNTFIKKLSEQFLTLKAIPFTTRKNYAEEAAKSVCPAFMFTALDNNLGIEAIVPFVKNMRRENLVKLLKLKDEKIIKPF